MFLVVALILHKRPITWLAENAIYFNSKSILLDKKIIVVSVHPHFLLNQFSCKNSVKILNFFNCQTFFLKNRSVTSIASYYYLLLTSLTYNNEFSFLVFVIRLNNENWYHSTERFCLQHCFISINSITFSEEVSINSNIVSKCSSALSSLSDSV